MEERELKAHWHGLVCFPEKVGECAFSWGDCSLFRPCGDRRQIMEANVTLNSSINMPKAHYRHGQHWGNGNYSQGLEPLKIPQQEIHSWGI